MCITILQGNSTYCLHLSWILLVNKNEPAFAENSATGSFKVLVGGYLPIQ